MLLTSLRGNLRLFLQNLTHLYNLKDLVTKPYTLIQYEPIWASTLLTKRYQREECKK